MFDGISFDKGCAYLLLNGRLRYEPASSRISNCSLLSLRTIITSALSAHQVYTCQTSLHHVMHAEHPVAAAHRSHLTRSGP